jgi:Secretion system C-terminal sorting domain
MTFKYLQKDYYKPVSTELNSSNMGYIENRGQICNSNGTSNTALRFYNDKSSPSTYIDDAKIGYIWNKSADTSNTDTLFRVDMQFNKGNSGKKVYPLDFKSEYYNFYLKPLTVGKERTLACNSVVKFDAYTNTDIIFTHNRKGYKTYIVARSGAPTANFEMQYTGQSSLTVNGTGQLVIGTSIGSKIQPKAKAYTMNNTTGVLTLLGWQPTYVVTSGNKVSFTYGTWPPGSTLVIEMEKADGNGIQGQQAIQNVDWSTFFGGSGSDINYDVINTAINEAYTCGYSTSQSYAQNTGTYIGWGQQYAFVCMFNEECEANWFSYYGGPNGTTLKSICLDDNGDIHSVGNTQEIFQSFSELGLNISAFQGVVDGLYLKFNVEGLLQADSYLGGIGSDYISAVAIDNFIINGEERNLVIMVGYTNGTTFFPVYPLTNSYYQTTIAGEWDGFIFAFDNLTNEEVWCTFYGGTGSDAFHDVTFKYLNGLPNLVVTGLTKTNFYGNNECGVPNDGGFPNCNNIYYPNASHETSFSGTGDYPNYFISEFGGENFNLRWSTYFGESYNGTSTSSPGGNLAYSNNGDGFIYLTGSPNWENILDFPYLASTNTNSYNKNIASTFNSVGFIAKFNEGNTLKWSTFIGGNCTPTSITANNENVFITGRGNNNSIQIEDDFCSIPSGGQFPICDYDGTYYTEVNVNASGNRTFITAFNTLDQMVWSTQYGADCINGGNAVSSSEDKLFLAGYTYQPYTLVDYNTGSMLDYFQDVIGGGVGDGTMARFNVSQIATKIEEPMVEHLSTDLHIFPNPSSEIIKIVYKKWFEKGDILQITDLTGQEVFSQNLMQFKNELNINISELSDGIYFVHLISNKVVSSTKFLKQ